MLEMKHLSTLVKVLLQTEWGWMIANIIWLPKIRIKGPCQVQPLTVAQQQETPSLLGHLMGILAWDASDQSTKIKESQSSVLWYLAGPLKGYSVTSLPPHMIRNKAEGGQPRKGCQASKGPLASVAHQDGFSPLRPDSDPPANISACPWPPPWTFQ